QWHKMRKFYIYAGRVIKFIKWLIVVYAATMFFMMLFANFIIPTPPISPCVDLKVLKVIPEDFSENRGNLRVRISGNEC
ncbi:19475_t:CDS:1, partial [Racocetra persica]